MIPSTIEAYHFFHQGTLALAEMEARGMLVDVKYLKHTITKAEKKRVEYLTAIKADKLYKVWHKRFGERTNVESEDQLAQVFYGILKFPVTEKTDTGKPSTDERALLKIDHPMIPLIIKAGKLGKNLNTYLRGIERELSPAGRIHPSINLAGGMRDQQKGGARSFRGSCSNPNMQNMPIRDGESGAMIRKAFIPPPGYDMGEVDFSQLEVRIAAAVTEDPRLQDYVRHSPPKCMHRDSAELLFGLTSEQVGKKTTRDAAKNRFVFPQFYGSYYKDCAINVWEMLEKGKWKVEGSDILVVDHLKKQGIKSRGACDGTPPKAGTFEHRVKEVEDKFWNVWFKHYTEWKQSLWESYLQTGRVTMPTGFTAEGVYRRNQVLNLPIQGPAFHCLLWSIIHIRKELRRLKMKSHVVMQIHDCLIAYIHHKERNQFLELAWETMTRKLPKAWKWINVPLETEADIVGQGFSWNDKKPWKRQDTELWTPA